MPKSKSKSNYNILLIDDSEDDYLYIHTLLEEAEQVNFNLTWINNLTEKAELLEKSKQIEPDLYLLNYLEGEDKGVDLLEILVEENSTIPCIFLTNNNSATLDRKALALGASDVLCKDNLLTSRLLERSILHALERSYFLIELRETTERLILAKTSANLGIWEYNVFEDCLVWDDRTCELYGINSEEFKDTIKDWEAYIYTDDLAEFQEKFQRCLESQDSFHGEFRILVQNKIRYIEIHGVVIGHLGQRSQRIIGVNLDISDRKQTEAKLQYMNHTLEQRIVERTESLKSLNVILKKQSESFYHTNQLLKIVMNSIPQGIFWKNRDSIFLGGNQRFADDVGISRDELKGKSASDLKVDLEEMEFYTQYDREVMETGQPRIHFLETLNKPDGSVVYMDTTKVPLRDQNGNIMGILGCYEDISDRKRVELEHQKFLQELSAFRTAIDRSASIAVTDSNGIILEANDRFCAISGYERSELVGHTHSLIKSNYHPTAFYGEMWRTIKQGNVWQGEICNRSKTGQLYWEESSIVPLLGTAGEPTRYLAVRYDISSRKLAEETIKKQAKQEKFLREITQRINHSLDLQSIFSIACNDIRLLLQCDRVCIFKFHSFSEIKNGVFLAESVNNNTQSILNFEIKSTCFGKEQINIYESGHSIVVDNIEQYNFSECLNDFLNQFEIKSCLIFPLRYSDRLWGLLCIHHGHSRVWKTSEIDLTQQLANQLAIAVQQASLVQQLQQELQDRQAIQQQLADRNEQLAIYNEELLRATRLKDEFLASMSHELRTPLNAILGMSEVLQEDFLGPINVEQREALQTIQRSGAHLLDLINDILDVAKIESGQLELHFTPVQLFQLCESSLSLVHLQALQKNITIQHSIPDSPPHPLLDERRIRQVLVNLLNNAVKFTGEDGSVSLRVTLAKIDTSSPKPYQLQLVVEDTGIGIAPEDLSRLFQPFVQVDSALNRQYAGTGLGLALVKRLVELHQGTVSINSELGVGSRFTVTIPCQVADREPTLLPPISPLPPANSFRVNALNPAPRILLAEDNLANVTTIKLYLESQGYEVFLAQNGAEAIVVAQSHYPQLILMDIQMPVVDGLEAIEILRRDPDFGDTPIIALTALAMPGDRDRCLASGATDYLSKPIQLKALDDCIQQHLSNVAKSS